MGNFTLWPISEFGNGCKNVVRDFSLHIWRNTSVVHNSGSSSCSQRWYLNSASDNCYYSAKHQKEWLQLDPWELQAPVGNETCSFMIMYIQKGRFLISFFVLFLYLFETPFGSTPIPNKTIKNCTSCVMTIWVISKERLKLYESMSRTMLYSLCYDSNNLTNSDKQFVAIYKQRRDDGCTYGFRNLFFSLIKS